MQTCGRRQESGLRMPSSQTLFRRTHNLARSSPRACLISQPPSAHWGSSRPDSLIANDERIKMKNLITLFALASFAGVLANPIPASEVMDKRAFSTPSFLHSFLNRTERHHRVQTADLQQRAMASMESMANMQTTEPTLAMRRQMLLNGGLSVS
jgi:hypothetical protein